MAKESYLLDASKIDIPDEGLGEFVMGFTEEHTPFRWSCLLWNLLPVWGSIVFITSLVKYWRLKRNARRILIYKNGFIKQTLRGGKNAEMDYVVNFNGIVGLSYRKKPEYDVDDDDYYRTTVSLFVLEPNFNEEEIITGNYFNEKDSPEYDFGFVAYACMAVCEQWFPFALRKFESELSEKGYGTFRTEFRDLEVGRNFINYNGVCVDSKTKYIFGDNHLRLYPEEGKPLEINIGEMYNKEVFLSVLRQNHGIS